MSSVFEFVAESRKNSGKGAARAIRRQGNVPAIIYGGSAAPEMLVLNQNEVSKNLSHEAVYSHILDIKVDGNTEKAILKSIQRHPAKARILHMDFMRISAKEKIRVHVPLHFTNEETSVGAKKGGITTHSLVDVEVSCLPSKLPEFLELDLAAVDVGESLHLTDIKLPAGVEIIALQQGADHDLPVVSIAQARGAEVDEVAEEEPDLDSDAEEGASEK